MAQNLNAALQALEAEGGQEEIYQALLRAAQMQNHANLRMGQMPLVPPIRPNFTPLPQGVAFPANMAELLDMRAGQINALLAAYQLPLAGTITERRMRLLRLLVGSNAEQAEGQDGN